MLCVYKAGIGSSLIKFTKKGGTVIATSDLFRKNEDNAYLDHPSPLHSLLPDGWESMTRGARMPLGEGSIIFLNPNATSEDWKEALEKTLQSDF
jgi:hypothetical protein